MQRKEKKHHRVRTFFLSFFITLMLMVMCVGFVVADYNTRKMTFGESRLIPEEFYQTEKQIEELSAEQEWWSGFAESLIPVRYRTLIMIGKEGVGGLSDLISGLFNHEYTRSYDKVEV